MFPKADKNILHLGKKTVVCFLFLSICFKSQSQPQTHFGKGKITVTWYILPDNNSRDTTGLSWNKFTFYINGNLILRHEDRVIISTAAVDTIGNNISTTMEMPTYLIDFDSKSVTGKRYSSKPDDFKTYELAKYNYDLFYRAYLKKHDSHFQKLDTLSDTVTEICGFKCYTGIANVDGQINKFAYTKEKLEVNSPLNGLLPKFPHQIIWYQAKNASSESSSGTISEFYITNVSKGLDKKHMMNLLK